MQAEIAMQKHGLGLCDVLWSCTFCRGREGSYSRAVQWSREKKGGHAWERTWAFVGELGLTRGWCMVWASAAVMEFGPPLLDQLAWALELGR